MKYTEFAKCWLYTHRQSEVPERCLRNNVDGTKSFIDQCYENGFFVITGRFIRDLYLFRRKDPSKHIVRMGMLYPSAGEIWYIRELLLNFPAYSLQALLCVDGTEYTSFEAAAIARGIIKDYQEAKICFSENITLCTPDQLRSLFISLTLEGFATVTIYNDVTLRNSMIHDYLVATNGNERLASNMLLETLQSKLQVI